MINVKRRTRRNPAVPLRVQWVVRRRTERATDREYEVRGAAYLVPPSCSPPRSDTTVVGASARSAGSRRAGRTKRLAAVRVLLERESSTVTSCLAKRGLLPASRDGHSSFERGKFNLVQLALYSRCEGKVRNICIDPRSKITTNPNTRVTTRT